ncbi:MAG: hypothetical protein JO257_28935 [Deltaproteobacteria bacterium]|nr:hypothetical protein [Deltaproteobacteria bacterium]
MRYLLFALLLGGCGLDRNIEGKVTIDQGVYGLLVHGCDSSGCQDQPAGGEHVTVYSASASSAYANADSDSDGVYQINLPAGDYTLCTYSCTPISVPDASIVRYDWTSGPGGGHWQRN